MAGNILCGTCGYDYPEWKGVFYPESLDRRNFLAYYATQFPALEINFSYYRMPTEYQFRSMLERTEGRLLFSVKAPQLFTHDIQSSWEQEVPHFKSALLPFAGAGVLSAVLFQFPQSFHYTDENRIYLSKLLAAFSDIPKVVEFRHTEWLTERVFENLDRRNTGICVCDMPGLKALPQFAPVVTGNIGYIRFHGRNAADWYSSSPLDSSLRYTYLYSQKELESTVPAIIKMAKKVKTVHVFFNNHPDGGAAANAKMMQSMIQNCTGLSD